MWVVSEVCRHRETKDADKALTTQLECAVVNEPDNTFGMMRSGLIFAF